MHNRCFRGSKYLLIILFSLVICLQRVRVHSQPVSANTRKILFLGNSITWAGVYVNDIEAYLRLKYPGREMDIINAGLASETVSGLSEPGHAGGSFPRPDLHERLSRVLEQVKPDLVFACYGMNDGIYLPFDAQRFQKFKDGINRLHAAVVKSGARIIHLTPPDYDEQRGGSKGYSVVLDRYSDWLLGRRAAEKWEVVDIHYPMQNFLRAHRAIDRKFGIDGFALADDGVHPGNTGHWIIAKQVLLHLGFKEVAGSGDIITGLKGVAKPQLLVNLVAERQQLMRDSWLSATRHRRPGVPVGLPLDEAGQVSAELIREINAVVANKQIAEVYLLGGQSNATGQGYLANRGDTMNINPSVLLFHSGKPHLDCGGAPYTWEPMHQASESPDRFGPELGFASAIKASIPGATVALIKHAHSGTNLYSEWSPGKAATDSSDWGPQFKAFMYTVQSGIEKLKALGYEPVIRGMLWQQGEQEAFAADSISVQYGPLLKHLVMRLRAQFGAPRMLFVYGYVCPPPLTSAGIRTVRQAQHDVDENSCMALSVNRAYVIPTDGLSQRANDKHTKYPNDNLHFGTDGTWVLGVRMALRINAAPAH
jgi:lysophospholipase L1-like esterase